jgi:hypothetical protein
MERTPDSAAHWQPYVPAGGDVPVSVEFEN